MKQKSILRICVFILFVFFSSSFFLEGESVNARATNSIILSVSGLRNSTGFASALLFRTKDGYPENVDRAYRKTRSRISSGKAELVFQDVPDGFYVIACIHDENENEKFDKNFIGYPKEGAGFSNNTKINFGPPSFDEGLFNHKGQTKISIKMQYF